VPSSTTPERIRLTDSRLHIPKAGRLVIRRKGDNPYRECRPASATVKNDAGRWYIGIDRNVGQVVLADGRIIHTPRKRPRFV